MLYTCTCEIIFYFNNNNDNNNCGLTLYVVLDHHLDHNVTVELMGVRVLVSTAPVLVGPFDGQKRLAASRVFASTLEVFLRRESIGDGGRVRVSDSIINDQWKRSQTSLGVLYVAQEQKWGCNLTIVGETLASLGCLRRHPTPFLLILIHAFLHKLALPCDKSAPQL